MPAQLHVICLCVSQCVWVGVCVYVCVSMYTKTCEHGCVWGGGGGGAVHVCMHVQTTL